MWWHKAPRLKRSFWRHERYTEIVTDPADLELNSAPVEPPDEPRRPSRRRWTIVLTLLLVSGGGLWYWSMRRDRVEETPAQEIVPPAAVSARDDPKVVGDDIPLPLLPEVDPLVRDLVRRLSSHPAVAAWLATKGLIENFTVVTLNISEGKTPTSHLRPLAPRARFQVSEADGAMFLDARSYQRYNTYAEAVEALDAAGVARLYLTLKPRILDAYRELGHPDGDFDPVLERAIGELLDAPLVEGAVALEPKVLSYAFADPKLEELSPAQKQFMRMGPRNMLRVQSKLREIATLLGLRPVASSAGRP